MVRIILDTNVLINGVQDEYSFAYRIISLCLEGELQPMLNQTILREHQFLADQLISDEQYLVMLDDYYEICEMVPVRHSRPRNIIIDDPEDEKFLDAAETGRAAYIISDDHHLLDLEKHGATRMVTPAEFWAIYRREMSTGNAEWNQWVKEIGL